MSDVACCSLQGAAAWDTTVAVWYLKYKVGLEAMREGRLLLGTLASPGWARWLPAIPLLPAHTAPASL
jgi:hypothetical protein